jgi:hypothetical protein
MGVLDKLVLVFNETWWPGTADFVARELVDLSGRWCVFLNYAALFKKPILVALNVAATAADLEALSDDSIVAEALQVCWLYAIRIGLTGTMHLTLLTPSKLACSPGDSQLLASHKQV